VSQCPGVLAVPAFKQFDNLRFKCEELLQSQLHCPGLPAEQLAEASCQKMLADLVLVQAELKSEQLAWTKCMVRLSGVELKRGLE
jgi:hypothetical protein